MEKVMDRGIKEGGRLRTGKKQDWPGLNRRQKTLAI